MTDSKRDWDNKLIAALWAYRITYKVTTWMMPLALMYGLEAVLPIEFEIQSLRLAISERLDTSKSLKAWLTGLETLNKGC